MIDLRTDSLKNDPEVQERSRLVEAELERRRQEREQPAVDDQAPWPTDYDAPPGATAEESSDAEQTKTGDAPQLDDLRVGALWPAFAAGLKEQREGVPTGLPGLDRLLGGGLPLCQVAELVGPPGVCKSSLALSIATSWALAGNRSVIWSKELPKEMALARLVSQHTSAPWGKVLSGGCASDVDATGDALADLPLYVYDGEKRELVARLVRGDRVLAVIDYLQLLGASSKDLRAGVEEASGWLVQLAKATGACVLAISSTSRQTYDLGADGKVDLTKALGMGRESGRIEFDAACVLAIAPFKVKGEEESERFRKAYLCLAKNRLGPTGKVAVEIDGLAGLVREIEPEQMPTGDAGLTDQEIEVEILRLVREQNIPSKNELTRRIRAQKQRVLDRVTAMLANGVIEGGTGKRKPFRRCGEVAHD